MTEECIFDIPIYRINQADYSLESKASKRKFVEKYLRTHKNGSQQYDLKEISEILEKDFDRNHSKIWQYNEIIGYFQIWKSGTRILCNLYLVTGRITKRTTNKNIRKRGKLFSLEAKRYIGKNEKLKMDLLNKIETSFKERFQGKYFLNEKPFRAILKDYDLLSRLIN